MGLVDKNAKINYNKVVNKLDKVDPYELNTGLFSEMTSDLIDHPALQGDKGNLRKGDL